METIYVLGSRDLFDSRFADYQKGVGHYFENEFKNWGAIKYSLDGQLAILEEEESKFLPEDLLHESVYVKNLKEVKAYLRVYKENWELPEEDLI